MHSIPEGIDIEIVRKPIRNIYIRIYPPDGRVVVTAPGRIPDRDIYEFLDRKRNWIIKQHNRLKNIPIRHPKNYIDGEYLLFEGREYPLNIIQGTGKPSVSLEDGILIMNIKAGCDRDCREKLMNSWYRSMLKSGIPSLKDYWQDKMQLKVSDVRIRQMKTKWGTCNIKERRIWLSLELAKYPDNVLEYVFVHEMVHLLERRHNKKFYSLMDKYLPEWKEIKKSMSVNID